MSALERFFEKEEITNALVAVNDGKVRAPYKVPDTVIAWGMRQVSSRNLQYRAVAAAIDSKLRSMDLEGISFSQFYKRGAKLKVHDGTTDICDAKVMASVPDRLCRPEGISWPWWTPRDWP